MAMLLFLRLCGMLVHSAASFPACTWKSCNCDCPASSLHKSIGLFDWSIMPVSYDQDLELTAAYSSISLSCVQTSPTCVSQNCTFWRVAVWLHPTAAHT